mgnify:FL=1
MEILGGLGRREERISVKGIDAFLLSEPLPGHESGGDVQIRLDVRGRSDQSFRGG